jgi:D-alanyl-lipoteichoic acid acyltransferase DltB (MBOAT superfamily)
MLFTSGEFLFVYLPFTLALFFLISRVAGNTAGAAWLVFASFVFYAYWLPVYTGLLAASVVFNYLLGNFILACPADRQRRRFALLCFAVGTDLLVLGYFKYANFFLDTVAQLSGRPLGALGVILPIGISFFTFTQIAYLADVFAGKVRERNPLHYALFVSYFPHLIAGPVLHHAEMMPQFALPQIYRPRLENFAIGLAFLVVGLAKKVLLADSWTPLADDLFDSPATAALQSGEAWRGVLAYTLQIYFDFSGYSDMAVGLSLLIGVRLPYNFNSPYKATSIIDFWRRWHMTLSRFLRDYLYFPLGGNRHGSLRRYLNLMITMLLGGLWHGASWSFVIWGGLHGVYLAINHAWRFLREGLAGRSTAAAPAALRIAGRTLAVTLTLLSVVVAWVFFRAHSGAEALRILGSMCAAPASPLAPTHGIELATLVSLGGGFAVALMTKNSQQLIDGSLTSAVQRIAASGWRVVVLAALVGAEVTAIALLALISASRSTSEFIYFNF